jgi:DNA-binding protein HU-beta
LDVVFDEISKALSEKKEVTVPGFGKFVAADRKARTGVNPKTGEKINIPATTVPKFKAGKALKDMVK